MLYLSNSFNNRFARMQAIIASGLRRCNDYLSDGQQCQLGSGVLIISPRRSALGMFSLVHALAATGQGDEAAAASHVGKHCRREEQQDGSGALDVAVHALQSHSCQIHPADD